MVYIMNSIRSKYDDKKLKGERQSRDVFANALTSKLTTLDNFIGQTVRVPAKYYIEIRYGEEIVSVMSFPYDPDSVSYNRPSPSNITYTLGGVIREANTVRRHNITMSGRSGLATRIAYTRKGGLIYAEGEDVFQEFDEFFKRYHEICAQEFGLPNHITASEHLFTDINKRQALGGKDNGLVMVLRCLDEDLHLKVEPVNFSWNKNTSGNRFDYRWTCDFVGYDYAEKYTNPVLNVLNRARAEVNGLAGNAGLITNSITNLNNDYVRRFTGVIRTAVKSIDAFTAIPDTATSTFEAAKADIVDSFSSAKSLFTSDKGPPPLPPQGEIIPRERDVLNSNVAALALVQPATGRDDASDDEVALFNSQYISLQNSVENLRGTINREFYQNRIININSENATRIHGEFLTDERNYALLSKGYNFNTTDDPIQKTGFDTYIIQKDEDLLSIANKFLGDASRWEILMEINKWRDARRDEYGQFPQPGKKILIPRSVQPITNPYGNRDDTIGFDVYMETNDISFKDGDIEIVGGNENIKQYVKNVLMTKSGEIPNLKSFGLPNLPNITSIEYGAAIVREALLRDDRILDVSDVILTIEDDTLLVDCNVQPKKGESIPVKTTV